ncbi:MAG: carbohydrate kinase family protein [bacterium]
MSVAATNGQGAAPFVAILGHSNLDIHLQVKDLPKPGQSSAVLHRRTAWGGTAANIAHQAAGLGVPARLWSLVGDDFPPAWRQALTLAGVDTAGLREVPGRATPTCFVVTDLLDRQSYLMDEGAMADMAQNAPDAAVLDGIAAGGWLHMATGDPLVYAVAADAARERGLQVALDPGQEMRWRYDRRAFEGLLNLSHAFFVNEEELRVAADFLRYGAPEQFLDHVDTVVVTRGASGASLYRRKAKTLHLPAFPTKIVDPTGAGDAVRAGWYAALHAGKPMETALRWGLAAASLVVRHVGGQTHVVTRAELDAVLATTSAA